MARTEGAGRAASGALRLLYLNHNTAYSGTFFRALHLGRILAGRGHEVTLVTTHRTSRFRAARSWVGGVEMIEAPDLLWGAARTGWDAWNTVRRIGLIRGRAFDIVHGFDSRPAVILPALAVRRRTGGALVLDWADWWGRGGTIQERSGWLVRTAFGPIETWFEEAFRLRATGSTVISTVLEERLRGLGYPADRILRFPHGCDPSLEPLDRAEARAALGVADGPLVVHLGVLNRGDAALLFDAFRVARAAVPGARLVLIGRASRDVPSDLVAAGAVVRTGRVSLEALRQWLAAADVCVVSLMDSIASRGRWPSKINDYFSMARATVMTRVGDAATLVERAGAGWVAEPAPGPFGEAIAAALRDPDACRAAGERARALAESELSWASIGAAVERFYREVVLRRGRPGRSPAPEPAVAAGAERG